jgi:hypothetical protein
VARSSGVCRGRDQFPRGGHPIALPQTMYFHLFLFSLVKIFGVEVYDLLNGI